MTGAAHDASRARDLAERWYAAWNGHDLEAIMACYAPDIDFASPRIRALGFGEEGVICGASRLRDYFAAALARAPDLAFTPESLCLGVRTHTLIYRNHRSQRAAETHVLDTAGRIARADATYDL